MEDRLFTHKALDNGIVLESLFVKQSETRTLMRKLLTLLLENCSNMWYVRLCC